MTERPIHNQKREQLFTDVDFPVSSETLSLIRYVLENPFAPPNPVAMGTIKDYANNLGRKLPLPVKETVIPLSLCANDVNFITAQIGMRRFDINSETGQVYLTKYRQAYWDLNVEFTKASGIMTTNFEGYLKRFKLLEYDVK